MSASANRAAAGRSVSFAGSAKAGENLNAAGAEQASRDVKII